MDWGLKNRISRIIKPQDKRALMLAVDHGYFLGPTEKLENPRKVIAPLLEYCDSLMVTRGIQRTSVPATTGTPMVLRVSGGSSIIGDDLSQEDITVSIQDAIKLNASALAMSIFVGSKYEYQTIVNLGKLVSEAEKYGLPVLAVTAVGKELGKDARYLSLACRIAAEQGAHIVKTYYCDNFEKVVESCPVPIIVAGGKKTSELDALRLTYNAIKGGAVGVDMGRNIWQSDHPVSMIKAVRTIVHGKSTADDAYKLYQKLVSEEPKGKSSLSSKKPNNNTGKPNNNNNNNNNPRKPNNNNPAKPNNNNNPRKPNNNNNNNPRKPNNNNNPRKPNNNNNNNPRKPNNRNNPTKPNNNNPTKPNNNNPTKPTSVDQKKPNNNNNPTKPNNNNPTKPTSIDEKKPNNNNNPTKPTSIDEKKPNNNNNNPTKPTSVDQKKPNNNNNNPTKPTSVDQKKPNNNNNNPTKPTSVDQKKPNNNNNNPTKPTSIDEKKPTSIDEKKPTSIDEKKPTSIDEKKPTTIDEKKLD